MRGVLVILDGVAGLPHPQLDGKTPLEVAETPNLDYFARHGEMGEMYTVRKGFVPESDEAIVSLFGNKLISSSRGQLECNGADLDVIRGDLALRVNFGTVDEKGNIVDRRAGRNLTDSEAQKLSKAINNIKLDVPFNFEPTVQHRACLVLKGGFSDAISPNDLTYVRGKSKESKKIQRVKALGEENSNYTANVLNDFLKQSSEILKNHPVNESRKEKGLLPANYLLIRGPGVDIPKLKKYKNWLSLAYMPLEIGFSRLSGMDVKSFSYPKLKGLDAYKNLNKALRKACKYSQKYLKKFQKKYDYFYVHLKETDLPGHDNKPLEKKQMLEYIDKTVFSFLRKLNEKYKKKLKVVVTADHSTPCILKDHSSDPVPVLLYNNSSPTNKKFCEKHAKKGSLGQIIGKDFLSVVGFK